MGKHVSLAAVMAALGTGSSRHRKARVLRFIHRHPAAHGKIIGQLRRRAQSRERRARKRQRKLLIAGRRNLGYAA